MYHKPRKKRSWFAGWRYLLISFLLATPLTATFTFLGIQSAPYGALQMVWWFLAVTNAVLTCGILMLTSFRIGR